MLRTLKYVVILLLCAGNLSAQSYIKFHYTQRNGLPQNSVIDLFRDSSQYLWITTEDGLLRFDGHTFQINNISNTPFIKNDRFRWIYPNINGQILAAPADGRLVEIRNNKVYPYFTEGRYKRIQGVLPERENLIKLMTADPEYFQRKNDIPAFPIQLVSIEKETYVLGYTAIYKLEGLTKTDTIAFSDEPILSIFNIRNQGYALGAKHLYRIDPLLHKLVQVTSDKPLPIGAHTEVFYQPITQNTCILNNHRLYILNTDKGKPEHIKVSFLLDISNEVAGPIGNISVDENSGIVAIGSLTNGLYLFKPKPFTTKSYVAASEPINGSYAIVAINDSTILTANGAKISNHTTTKSNYTLRHINNMLLHFDRRGRLWSCRGDSLFYQIENHPRVLFLTDSSNYVMGLGSYGDSLMVSTGKHIILIVDGKLVYKAPFQLNQKPYGIKFGYGTYLYRYQNKWLFAIENIGLTELTLGKSAVMTKLADIKQIRFLTEIDGILFGGTYGNGWFAFINNKVIQLPLDTSHYLSKAHHIIKDQNGKLFITTNKGLFTTHISHVKRFLNNSQTTLYYQYYDDNDGIENIEFNGGCYPSGLALKDGSMVFPNIQGVVWFNPSNDKTNALPIPNILNLDYIEKDGKPISNTGDTLIVESGIEKITLAFSAIYWNNTHNLKLEYKVTGFQSDWISLDIQTPVVTITNLPNGEYDLIVRAQIGFNSNECTTYKIHIIKEPKYYETWIFVLLLASLLFFAIIGINFLYNRQLRNQNALLELKVRERTSQLEQTNKLLLKSESELMQSVNVKNKLISIISHDIVTPLKFISLASKNYRSAEGKSPDNEFIREIHHTSQRLFDNAQNILNWVRYQNNLIRVNKTSLAPFALVDEIAELFKELAFMRKNTIVNDVDMDDVIVSDKTILIIILQNLIANAVKYTHSSTITISSRRLNGQYQIVVSDDGNGISNSNMRRIHAIQSRAQANTFEDSADGTGLGYIIIFELAELIDASVTVETELNKGTQVSITLA